ncbi:MAG TPA: GAF domain-containing protein [Anaerolineaceae bacterium]
MSSNHKPDLDWNEYVRLGEQITRAPDQVEQIEIICTFIQKYLQGSVQTWLFKPHYPLPGADSKSVLDPACISAQISEIIPLSVQRREPVFQENTIPERAEAAIPLIANDNLLGIIYVTHLTSPRFSAQEIHFLEQAAYHCALTLEISRQEAIKQWRNDQLNLVRSVSQEIASIRSLDELCKRVSFLIQKSFRFYYVAIFTLDQPGNLHFRACGCYAEDCADIPIPNPPIGVGIIGQVGRDGIERYEPDVNSSTTYKYYPSLPNTQSEFAIPLKVGENILGVLDIQSDQIDGFHEIDQIVLRSLAENISMAIESIQLYSEQKHRADQLETISEVSRTITSILDQDQLLEMVVSVIQKRFGYPYVHIFSVHPGRRLVIYEAGSGERSKAMKARGLAYPLDEPIGMIPWVARNGKTMLANNTHLEPLYVPSDLPPDNTQAELTIPLKVGEQILGVMDIQSDVPEIFDPQSVALLEAVGGTIAVAIRNATLYHSEQWRRQVADSFRDIAYLVSANHDLTQILEQVLQELERNLPCGAAAIWLVDRTENTHQSSIRLSTVRGVDESSLLTIGSDPAVQSHLQSQMKSLGPVIRKSGDPPNPLAVALNYQGEYSSLVVPLSAGDHPLGLLTIVHPDSGRYGSEAKAMCDTFASYAAIAIQNTRLIEDSQEQAWISTMLLQVSESSQMITNIDELLQTMVGFTRFLIGVRKCAFLLWEEKVQGYFLKAWYGFTPPNPDKIYFETDLPVLQRLRADQTIQHIPNPASDLSIPEISLPTELGSLVLLPMTARGTLIGGYLIALQTSTSGLDKAFDQRSMTILQGIAQQTASAIDNIQLEEARQEEAYVTAAMLQVAQTVASFNELGDILDNIVHLLPILVGIDTSVIYLWNREVQEFQPKRAYAGSRRQEETILSRSFTQGSFPLLDSAYQQDQPFICLSAGSDSGSDMWCNLPCFPIASISTRDLWYVDSWLVGFPLSVQGRAFGVLVVKESGVSPVVHEKRLEFINGIAQQTALAIENERLRMEMVQTERLEREFQLARQIQETFLPDRLITPEGWDVSASWVPAHEMGGDFYDIFEMGNHRVGIVIADVADKGMPAALYMAVTRALIRALLNLSSPGKIFSQVNALLVNDSPDSMFITAILAILNTQTGEMLVCNAGHNLPLIWNASQQEVHSLPRGEIALGVINQVKYTDHLITIHPNDQIIFYTDGITETFSPDGEPFGVMRLVDVIKSCANDSAGSLIEEINNTLLQFRGTTPPQDDITLFILKRLPLTERKNDLS